MTDSKSLVSKFHPERSISVLYRNSAARVLIASYPDVRVCYGVTKNQLAISSTARQQQQGVIEFVQLVHLNSNAGNSSSIGLRYQKLSLSLGFAGVMADFIACSTLYTESELLKSNFQVSSPTTNRFNVPATSKPQILIHWYQTPVLVSFCWWSDESDWIVIVGTIFRQQWQDSTWF